MNPETTYLQHLGSIERIAAFVARKNHLHGDDAAEFVQVVRVRLFENDYDIIRKFEGRSTFTTYLNTVIQRIFHQCRVEQWGKWRPSAEARRLGDKAILLERMLTRDGYTFREAVMALTTRTGPDFTVPELEALYIRLPLRTARPVLVSDDTLPDPIAVDTDADERVERRDRRRSARRTAKVLDAAISKFAAEDRVILQMRFWDARKVPDIARVLGLDQKKIYKRLDKLFAILRRALESAGVSRADVDKLLGRGDQDIHLDILPDDEEDPDKGEDPPDGESSPGAPPPLPGGETPPFGPSHPTGEENVRGGEGRLP